MTTSLTLGVGLILLVLAGWGFAAWQGRKRGKEEGKREAAESQTSAALESADTLAARPRTDNDVVSSLRDKANRRRAEQAKSKR